MDAPLSSPLLTGPVLPTLARLSAPGLLLVAFQVYASIVREKSDTAFYDVTLGQRAGIAAAYFILVVFLGHQTYVNMHRLAALAK